MTHLPARSTDPATSWEAAEEIVASGKAAAQQAKAAAVVKAHPGRTSAELAALCDLDRYQLARRLPEVEESAAVFRGDARKCTATGHKAATWWPVRS